MIRPYLPLNNLRAFEVAARHLSFTNAAIELRVTPAALSQQVKALEDRLGFPLFSRLPRGLALTDEGRAMLPVLSRSFDEIALLLERLAGSTEAVLSVGVVGTSPRLDLDYEEDVRAAVDMNVVMSSEGQFVEVQGTGEHGTFDRAQLDALLDVAVKGLRELDAAQQRALAG